MIGLKEYLTGTPILWPVLTSVGWCEPCGLLVHIIRRDWAEAAANIPR